MAFTARASNWTGQVIAGLGHDSLCFAEFGMEEDQFLLLQVRKRIARTDEGDCNLEGTNQTFVPVHVWLHTLCTRIQALGPRRPGTWVHVARVRIYEPK